MEPLKPADPPVLGDIELHGVLGEGGMGKVYFGVTPDGLRVAVKVIHPHLADRTDVRARFDREIAALRMVQGPRVAVLVDAAGPEAEQPWLAMEYVRGQNLRDHVETDGPLTADMGAALGELLAEALAEIHAAGLLHRDLKPANILLGRDGPKVIDFGLVALTESASDLTGTASPLGTLICMPPEQAESARDVTRAADVYGLGATLLFALTGHYPYEPGPAVPVLRAITDLDTPPDLSGLPADLAPLITAMLAHDPAARPTTAEVAKALRSRIASSITAARVHLVSLTYVEQAGDPPVDVAPPPPPARPRRDGHPLPTLVVARLADRLRSGYDRGGVL